MVILRMLKMLVVHFAFLAFYLHNCASQSDDSDPVLYDLNMKIKWMHEILNDCIKDKSKLDLSTIFGKRNTGFEKQVDIGLAKKTLNFFKKGYETHCRKESKEMDAGTLMLHLWKLNFQAKHFETLLHQCSSERNYNFSFGSNKEEASKDTNWALEVDLAEHVVSFLKTSYLACIEKKNECLSLPCQNGGTCVDDINSYTCTCVQGYAGTHCQTDIDECSSSPCQNNGTCEDGVNGYTCTCQQGYTRTHCESQTGCQLELTSIGSRETMRSGTTASNVGTWMKDPAFPGSQKIFSLYGPSNGYQDLNQIKEFASEADFKNERPSKTYTFPGFEMSGTVQVVYNRTLYGYIENSNTLVQYHLDTRAVKRLVLTGAGHDDQCYYDIAVYADIHFEVDELGLWVIYGYYSNNCKMKLSKVNPDDFTIEQTWTMSWSKLNLGNAFMICGKLYVVNSAWGSGISGTTKYIKYTYDTKTGQTETLPSNKITFSIHYAMSSLSYNMNEHKLYSWDYAADKSPKYIYQNRYSLTFKA